MTKIEEEKEKIGLGGISTVTGFQWSVSSIKLETGTTLFDESNNVRLFHR